MKFELKVNGILPKQFIISMDRSASKANNSTSQTNSTNRELDNWQFDYKLTPVIVNPASVKKSE